MFEEENMFSIWHFFFIIGIYTQLMEEVRNLCNIFPLNKCHYILLLSFLFL